MDLINFFFFLHNSSEVSNKKSKLQVKPWLCRHLLAILRGDTGLILEIGGSCKNRRPL